MRKSEMNNTELLIGLIQSSDRVNDNPSNKSATEEYHRYLKEMAKRLDVNYDDVKDF